jgi:hypothetical protein
MKTRSSITKGIDTKTKTKMDSNSFVVQSVASHYTGCSGERKREKKDYFSAVVYKNAFTFVNRKQEF